MKVELAQHKKHKQELSDQISNAEMELNALGFFAFSKKRALLELIERNKLSISQTSTESYNMQKLLELKCDIEKTSAQVKVKKDYSEKINKLLCDIKILKELAQDPLILQELTKDWEIVKLLAAEPYTLQEIIKDSETLKCLTKNHFVSIKQQIENEACTILFGNYPQNQENLKEPIAWRILDEKDGKVLLISDLVLYDRNIGYEDFMNSAFTQSEQTYIEKTIHTIDKRTKTIYEYDGPYYDEEGWFEYNRCDRVDSDRWSSSTMETKLFSLNMKELQQYFPTEEERIAFSTQILSEKSPFLNGKKTWVLHSSVTDTNLPTDHGLRNSFVDIQGNIKDDKYEQDRLGVRPAMWVNINC